MSIAAPTSDEEARANWDLLLTDLELRLDQVRQIKASEPRRLIIQGVTAAATLFGAGTAVGALVIYLLGK